jgi:hypothetical protein
VPRSCAPKLKRICAHQAELRAHVFLAIDEEETSTGGEGEIVALQ